MNIFEKSFFIKAINKLDLKEESVLFQNFKANFFLKFLNNTFSFFQNLFYKITKKSTLLAHIDHFILFLITILFISLTFASTATIGIISGLCGFAFLIKLFFKKSEKLETNSLDLPIFLYIFIIGISVAFSSLFIPAIKGYIKVLIYFLSYLTFFNVLKNRPKWSYYIIGIIAVTAFAESLTAIYQYFIGVEALATWQDKSGLNPEQIMNRVYGTLQPFNPNLLAGYLIACVSSVAGLFFLCIYKKNSKLSIYSLIAFIAVLLAIIFTGSRGAYLGLFTILISLVLISGHIIHHDFSEKTWLKKLWISIIALGTISILYLILSNPAFLHRIESIFSFREDSSNSFRMNVYISSIKMFLDNWIIGIGPGNEVFRLTYGLYMRTGFDALGAYSVPLEIAVESGIFALLAFLWLIIAIFIKGVKVILYGKDIEQKILISACIAGILGIMTHGLFDTIFFRPQVQIIFWMLVAIIAANSRLRFED